MGPTVPNSIYLEPTNVTEVSQIITDLKNKATSDTNIATIKKAELINTKFSAVLVDLINCSLAEGFFPDDLKLAKVIPIYKGESRIDIQNYRPISLLSAFSKVYEKVMYHRMYSFLSLNKVLNEYQYGFRKSRSCEHALLVAQNEVLTNLSKKQITVLLLVDFSKAFDMVDHSVLLKKLDNYGIRGNANL